MLRFSFRPVVSVLLMVAVMVAAPCAGLVGDAAAQARAITLSPEQQAFLSRAEAYMSTFRTAEARFLQVSSTGDYIEGTLKLSRPNRMRLDYDPPSPLTLIANGSHLIYIDNKLGQVSYLNLNATPLGILLGERISFSDPSVTITRFARANGMVEVTVVQSRDPGMGSLTLAFTENPLNLNQWRVLDAQGVEVTVSLFNVRQNVSFDPKIFEYRRPDPRNLPR